MKTAIPSFLAYLLGWLTAKMLELITRSMWREPRWQT